MGTHIVRPEATNANENTYDWDGIERIELMLEQASINTRCADEKFRNLKKRFEKSFLRKLELLKQEVPRDLKTVMPVKKLALFADNKKISFAMEKIGVLLAQEEKRSKTI